VDDEYDEDAVDGEDEDVDDQDIELLTNQNIHK